jgi:hypothetical protein
LDGTLTQQSDREKENSLKKQISGNREEEKQEEKQKEGKRYFEAFGSRGALAAPGFPTATLLLSKNK